MVDKDKKVKNHKDVYDSDEELCKIFKLLARDFSPTLGKAFSSRLCKEVQEVGLKALHSRNCEVFGNEDAYFAKCRIQLLNFAKRYRCKNDILTDEELELQAREKFLATQARISRPMDIGFFEHQILQKARNICSTILREYDSSEHVSLCTFGKRACVGHPYLSSYLDTKVAGPLTGSKQHLQWFKRAMRGDAILFDMLHEPKVPFKECESLPVSFVPKNYKSLRSVKPGTLIGTFYTLGLGRVIVRRLKEAGLNIRRLQEKHRELAKKNSVTRKLVTADLSAASDSITSELLRRVLPTSWYRAVMYGRHTTCSFSGSRENYRVYSVATMGDGHTFPLQTLVFYALLRAIQEMLGSRGKISVYGDDLIYPREMHKYVARVFPRLHLQLNMEKTYVSIQFRESCGGDYYRGVDVRPCSPEGEHRIRNRRQHVSFLYRVLNGLCRRWEKVEIPLTYEYIVGRIFQLSDEGVLQVPPRFPDGSGLRVEKPQSANYFAPVNWTSLRHMTFKFLHERSERRVVLSQFPYYWASMQGHSLNEEEKEDVFAEVHDLQVLIWEKARQPPFFITNNLGEDILSGGKKIRRLVPCVSMKSSTSTVVQEGSVDYWA